MEHMFDTDSFKDEITKPSEAHACYSYFAGNLMKFRQELYDDGRSSAEVESIIGQCWLNLAEASRRVGWSNDHLVNMAKRYRQEAHKEGK